MSKTNKIAFSVFLLLLALLVYMEASEPEPVNWNPSYSANDKIPLGTYVLVENFKEQAFEVQKVNQPPYEFLTDNSPEGIYFFLNNQLFFDDAELDKLLKWVSSGNTLFLAADTFSENLLDTLELEIATAIPQDGLSSKPMLNLVNPELKNETAFLFDHETYHSIFTEIDTLQHTVLGVSQLFSNSLQIEDPEINYLKIGFGNGTIFLNTTPQAFSNFFILEEKNSKYVERALGYLPSEEILYWDSYYKTGKSFYTSPLYILLNNKILKWAYYFALLGSLLFVLFEGKRKQRSIPIVKPPENKTYQFTRTIAGMYLDRKDYKGISSKKISFFLEYVRTHFRISTATINEHFYQDLSMRSGNSLEATRALFEHFQRLETKNTISKEELLKLNSAITTFKQNTTHGKRGNRK